MQLGQIGKIIRIGFTLFYPVMAVLIWFLPMLGHVPVFNKIALSTILVLYTALRIYRLVRRNETRDEA